MAIIVGAATVGLTVYRTKRMAQVTETRRYVQDRIAGARRDLDTALNSRVSNARHLVTVAWKRFIRSQTDQIYTALKVTNDPNRKQLTEAARRTLQSARQLETATGTFIEGLATRALSAGSPSGS